LELRPAVGRFGFRVSQGVWNCCKCGAQLVYQLLFSLRGGSLETKKWIAPDVQSELSRSSDDIHAIPFHFAETLIFSLYD
jgi:hypothetical protein